jgi:hypothetical protein
MAGKSDQADVCSTRTMATLLRPVGHASFAASSLPGRAVTDDRRRSERALSGRRALLAGRVARVQSVVAGMARSLAANGRCRSRPGLGGLGALLQARIDVAVILSAVRALRPGAPRPRGRCRGGAHRPLPARARDDPALARKAGSQEPRPTQLRGMQWAVRPHRHGRRGDVADDGRRPGRRDAIGAADR